MSLPNGIQSLEESENSQLLKVSSIDIEESGTLRCEGELSSQEVDFDMKEISYAISAFYATLQPVAITLILSSLVVIYVKSPFSQQSGDGGLSIYDISDGSEASVNDSNTVKLGKSMINALVIVCAMALMTFVIVFLYWARCMQCIQGYMIFSSFMLLCFMGGIFFYTVVCQLEMPLDWITFFVVLYNFSVVGVIAIFFQKGIPSMMTQGYLIATSILLVWQLSRFDEYTCFSLLVALSFYDLCAVLTPCGPLKALVGLMQERNVPLPGLLYEANMSGRNRGRTPSNASNSTSNRSTSTIKNNKKKKKNEIFHNRNESEENNRAYSERERDCSSLYDGTPEECSPSAGCRTPVASTIFQSKNSSSGAENIAVRDIRSHHRTAVLALPSKLTIAEDQILVENPILLGDIGISVGGMNSENNRPFGSSVESKPGLEKENDEDGGIKIKDYSTRSDEVDVDYLSFSSTPSSIFPYHYPSPSFGTVRESVKRNEERNAGEDSNDSQEIPDSEYDSDSSVGDSSDNRSSIKLGLGDFVFYSLLVSRSCAHGFPTFIATSFVVLAGLGVTLILLAVYKQALPALPISILLGVATYFLTRYFAEPFLTSLTEQSLYI